VGLGEDDNIFNWELMIVGPPDTLYEGGFFQAKLAFPQDFPNSPPVMTFMTPMWHPNGLNSRFQYFVYSQVCSL
jgi:ubiquitin-conjugating enzyme E2 G1